jgi:P-type Ca2+ transporter type 2C
LTESDAFSLSIEDLQKKLETNFERGLSQHQAEERLQSLGLNLVPKVAKNRLRSYLAPLSNWLISIYLIVSTILAFLALFILPSLWFQVAVWVPIISGNVIAIIVQSIRAEIGLTALHKLSNPKSNVKRDGKIVGTSSENLVPGDVIAFKQGDLVPADVRIISNVNLRVNEAILTGESNDVEKSGDAPDSLDEKRHF